MKNAKISKTFTDLNTYLGSKELETVFSPYEARAIFRHKNFVKKHFIEAYVVSVDPEENYGRDFILYEKNKSSEGLICLNEIDGISIMSSYDLRGVEIVDGNLIVTGETFKKTKEGREKAIKNEISVESALKLATEEINSKDLL